MSENAASSRRTATRSLVLCALMAALTAICSQIQIPLPMVPINLALFAVHLSGALLGWKYGALSMVVYALLGVIGVADRLRPDAAETVRRLKKLGVELWLITGDNERTAQAVAAECDIEYVLSGVLPENKAEKVRELQSRGLKLAMVGDGINDAPALAAADTAIAMGGGTDVAIESSDITLLGGRLSAVPDALEVSRATMGAIRLNLAWALLYNVLSVGAAAFGVVNPAMAAAAMSLSSIAVLMNSLRLKKAVEKK